MNRILKSFLPLVLCGLALLYTACSDQNKREELSFNNLDTIPQMLDFEVADRFLRNLKNDQADTILFYKRTCVGCCDFYHVFWSKDGERHAACFSDNLADMVERKEEEAMKTNDVLDVLGESFSELKTSTIKPNRRTHVDSTYTEIVPSHYCYSNICVYTDNDSIVSGSMKDHDFDKYVDFNVDSSTIKSSLETNENYEENVRSKWYVLLKNIEMKISEGSEVREEEKQRMMTMTK